MRMEQFVRLPNLSASEVALAVVDGRVDKGIVDVLLRRGIRLIMTQPVSETYEAVSWHPDMMLQHLGGSKIVVAPNIHNKIVYALEQEGFDVSVGARPVGAAYPQNVAYNAARVGNLLVCSVRNTDDRILEHAAQMGLSLVDVRQGYAKCSICVVAENAVITADNSIVRALDSCGGIDCCHIQPAHILLAGMNYGFIGGASGMVSAYELAFYGNIANHPDCFKIEEFLSRYGKKTLNLCEKPVMDFGTLIPLKEYSIVTK